MREPAPHSPRARLRNIHAPANSARASGPADEVIGVLERRQNYLSLGKASVGKAWIGNLGQDVDAPGTAAAEAKFRRLTGPMDLTP